ncbi:MAG TPA: histone deacetylase [Acidimicrobiia bacterium]|nr:histone deacetylase [Acidimicrobiia bacterium]
MEVVVAIHPSALRHDTGPRHPERAARVGAVLEGVRDSGLTFDEIVAPPIERSELALVHDSSYIEMIEKFCQLGGGALDMDTFAGPATWDAALTAAGGVRVLVEELVERSDATGFAVSRPPGHHAMPDRAMGFCIFNNVAVTAAYLRSRRERVAILDWDVHHGNGTQAMLADDAGVLYASIHQDGFYPFEGHIDDIDRGDAKGTVVNIPLPAGTAGDIYRRGWEELVLPVVAQFGPDWVLVSAGFDAHANDELASFFLESPDYGWMASRLASIHPPGRTIFALEGGYDLTALRESARQALLGLEGANATTGSHRRSPDRAASALSAAAEAIGRHWRV